jgi:hypothetical protein
MLKLISRDNTQRLVYRKCTLLLDRASYRDCFPSSRVRDIGFGSFFRFCEQTHIYAITP